MSYQSIFKLRGTGGHRLRAYKYKNICAHKIIITIWRSFVVGLACVQWPTFDEPLWPGKYSHFIPSIFWSRKCGLRGKTNSLKERTAKSKIVRWEWFLHIILSYSEKNSNKCPLKKKRRAYQESHKLSSVYILKGDTDQLLSKYPHLQKSKWIFTEYLLYSTYCHRCWEPMAFDISYLVLSKVRFNKRRHNKETLQMSLIFKQFLVRCSLRASQ